MLDAGLDLHRENTRSLTGPRHDEVAHGACACIVCVVVGDVQTFRAVPDGPFKGRSLFIHQRECDGRCCVSYREAATQAFFLSDGHDKVHVTKGQSVWQSQVPRRADQARIHGRFAEQVNVEKQRCAVFSFHAQRRSLEHTVVIQVGDARGDLRRSIAWKARERHACGQGDTGPRRRVDASHVGSKPGARRIQHLHGTLHFDDRGGCTRVLDDGTKVKPAHGVHGGINGQQQAAPPHAVVGGAQDDFFPRRGGVRGVVPKRPAQQDVGHVQVIDCFDLTNDAVPTVGALP